jgi:hypothetical protein
VAWLGAFLAAAAVASAPPVTIAVVDTGANVRAPEIATKRPATYDIRSRGRDVQDLNGHGTIVASLVARASGNARLLIIRAGSSSGAFSDANEAAAIRYAVSHGARVLNLSFGGPRTSAVERAAIRYAIGRGGRPRLVGESAAHGAPGRKSNRANGVGPRHANGRARLRRHRRRGGNRARHVIEPRTAQPGCRRHAP